MHIASMANDLTPGPLAPRAGRPSSPESDILDYYDASSASSSCYSRRSSRTSIDSDPPGAPTAADAYSIGSPVALGVFDEDQRRGWPADRNKPLPGEPPIALAPLQVRRPARSQQPSVKSSSTDRTASDVLRPSLAQAAADLENALDACATAANQAHHANHGDSPRAHGRVAENASSGPLQISRGAMLMRPSRPAPHPPADILPHSLQTLHPPCVPKKSRKMPFHLTVPGLGRRLHLRSLSGSNVRSEMEADRDHHHHGAHHHDRPSSLSNERELRRQLPRLQTKKMDVGLTGALAAMTATATATATTISLNHAGSHGSHSPRLRSSSAASSESLGGPVETVQPGQPEPEPEPEPVDEKVFVACSKRRNNSYVLPYQPGSRPQIIYELDSMQTPPVAVDVHPSSPSSAARSLPRAASSRTAATWPAAMPDDAVRSVLEQAASLDDLFSLAVVNRQCYRLFQRHELDLIKHAVFQMSPPAWELREMSPPWDTEWQLLLDPDAQVPDYTPTLYLQRYAHDIFTLAQLKSLILARCCSFLRPGTINGLAGVDPERATAIDDAFWRVWTFCRIFGCGKGRETDIPGQMDWLNGGVQARSHQHQPLLSLSVTEPFGMNNVLFEPPPGFARGNLGGLSQSQMYDMTELFTCLSVLLQPIHGKCAEARAAGLYNGFDLKCGDHDKEEQMLEEWTAYLLTLGLSAVLSLGSICPIKDATTTFQKAKDMGLTKWDLSDAEVTRSSFLKEAVSKTYKSREDAVLAAASQQSLHSSAASTASSSSSSRSSLAADSSDQQQQQQQPPPFQENRVRQAAFAAELRKQRSQPGMSTSGTSFSDERPISSYTVVMDGLDGVSQPPPSPPPPPIPHVQPTRWSAPVGSPVGGSVLDPVDRAIDMMVRELGFRDTEAKWALRTTDTGEGVDVNAAVNLLVREREASASAARGLGTISEEPLRWA